MKKENNLILLDLTYGVDEMLTLIKIKNFYFVSRYIFDGYILEDILDKIKDVKEIKNIFYFEKDKEFKDNKEFLNIDENVYININDIYISRINSNELFFNKNVATLKQVNFKKATI